MSSTAPGPRRSGELTRKGQQTRQRIVAAAAGLILQQGVAGTTLDDVRAEAGVSSSQIYHYFADKEALVRAVVDYQADRGRRDPRARAGRDRGSRRPAGLARHDRLDPA
jgi:AcrR family transcriptional regulator